MSDKPVAERLQMKGDRRLAVIGASPAQQKTVGAAEARAGVGNADVVVLFARNHARLDAELPDVLTTMPRSAAFWVTYPKLSSKLAADFQP
jgi:hypothetical protein